MPKTYRISIAHTNRDYFDYEGGELTAQLGARVWVPFRNSKKLGVVIGFDQTESDFKLKALHSVIDEYSLIPHDILTLCRWIGEYYQSPLSEVLPLALPKKYRLGHDASLPTIDIYQLTMPLGEAKKLVSPRAHQQIALIDYLNTQSSPVSKAELTQQGFTTSQLLALVKIKVISLSQQKILPRPSTPSGKAPPTLNAEQHLAVATVVSRLTQYHCFLLQGVTGSGKTEVYLQVIAQVLAQGKQVLVLVPEIGLTPQLLSRFTARFAEPMAVLHSNLNDTERQIIWQQARENHLKLIIGTRTALFTPLSQLGLIIIDEEHDSSLKQMEGVRYSARDSALMRAYFANIPIILGSATPSLESIFNCNRSKYTLLSLPHRALTNTPLHIQLIDLRAQTLHHGLASSTLNIIATHLQQNNQVLVFINRRGYAPVILCHQCGWMVDCKACDTHLTYHKQYNHMICHHCGHREKQPQFCSRCQSNELIPVGVGTQRIHAFLTTYFPDTTLLRIDRDEVSKKDSLTTALEKINTGEAQLIVGTQMLAKGHDFPRLTLVVVLDADAGFYNQDFRATEHLGQLLTQVAGRAGRAQYPGQVVIQTYLPQHPMLNLLIQQGYEPFAHDLLAQRHQAGLPPFQHMALIRSQGKDQAKVTQFLHDIKQQIKRDSITLMGPAPAPLPRKANQHRMQLLIKSTSRSALSTALTELRERLKMNPIYQGIRWSMDVDPIDLS